jgi:hypothetical protein
MEGWTAQQEHDRMELGDRVMLWLECEADWVLDWPA